MRPNFAQDAPPTEISVAGHPYSCATDYRVWLDVIRRYRDIHFNAENEEQLRKTAAAIEDIQCMVFGGVLADERLADVLRGVSEFMKGYPSAPMSAGGSGDQIYSFEYDLNEIIIAIKDQHGVDLSYRNPDGCHWWEFLLYFHTLSGDHYILNLMSARGYKGKDKEMLKRKARVALPVEVNADEQAAMDAFNAMFE